MGLPNVDTLIARGTDKTKSLSFPFWCYPAIAGTVQSYTPSGWWYSLWRHDKTNGNMRATSIPASAGASPTYDTAGVGPIYNSDFARTNNRYLSALEAVMAQGGGTFMIYDRLWHNGGCNATSTSTVTPTGVMGRYRGSADVCLENEIWVEVYTQVGSTQRTLTINYYDKDLNPQVATAPLGGSSTYSRANAMWHVTLPDGIEGVRYIDSFALDASTGTAGSYGLTIVKPLAVIPAVGTVGRVKDLLASFPIMAEVHKDAALALAFMPASSAMSMAYLQYALLDQG